MAVSPVVGAAAGVPRILLRLEGTVTFIYVGCFSHSGNLQVLLPLTVREFPTGLQGFDYDKRC